MTTEHEDRASRSDAGAASETGSSRSERHRGRQAALQLLYQWEVGRLDVSEMDEAVRLFWDARPAPDARRVFATDLARGTAARLESLDPLIQAHAEHWRLSRMAVVDRLILRLAVYEFLYTDTPRAVVIDEALELAKTFSGDDAVPFVNGVLDGIRKSLDAQQSST